MRTTLGLVLGALFLACSAESVGNPSSNDAPPGNADASPCAEGFAAPDPEVGCVPVLPPDACPTGTRAQIGSSACVPAGATECAAGFAKDASGWGCDAILPPAACAGATRERLGGATCEPVSDCNAPFPPAGATLFVDATHHRTIAEALAVAKAGDVIAVDSGTYEEHLVVKESGVRIVGRCAEKVVVQQKAGVSGSAIEVGTSTGIAVEGLSFRGYNAAVSVLGGKAELRSLVIEDGTTAGVVAANPGTEVSLENVVIRGMRARAGGQSMGLFASHGAKVTVSDSVLSGNEMMNVGATKAKTTVALSRTIVRDGKPLAKAFGMGVYAAEGASVTIDESAIVDNIASGVNIHSKNATRSSGKITRSVVRRTKFDAVNGVGRGVEVTSGSLVVEKSTIGGSAQIEVIAAVGSDAQLTDTTLLGDGSALGLITDGSKTKTRSLAIVSSRAALEIQSDASLEMDASLIHGTAAAKELVANDHWIGLGILVESKAALTLSRSTIEGAHVAGILVNGKATLTDTLVRGTRPSLQPFGGRGLGIQVGGVGEVSRSAFIDNTEIGDVAMIGGSALSLVDSTVSATRRDALAAGDRRRLDGSARIADRRR